MPEQAVGRWVAPVDNKVPRTPHGLLDSVTLSRDWYTGERPQPASDLVSAPYSYVLLAPGGAGKTTLIDALKSQETGSHTIDLRLHDRRSLIAELQSLVSVESSPDSRSVRTVFIDSVDVALQSDPDIAYALVSSLRSSDASRIAWRFACRPGSWTAGLSEGLSGALPGFAERELLPLSLAEITQMIGNPTETGQFLTAVERTRLTRLLAYPLQAKILLQQWRQEGELPTNRAGAMDYAVTRMLTEGSNDRPIGTLDNHRRRAISERLAAISLFCGMSAFVLGSANSLPAASNSPHNNGSTSTLPIDAVPAQDEPGLSQLPCVSG